jgi:hypothetical protein
LAAQQACQFVQRGFQTVVETFVDVTVFAGAFGSCLAEANRNSMVPGMLPVALR